LVMKALRRDVEYLLTFTKELSDGILVRVKDDSWTIEEQIRVLVHVKEHLLRMEEETNDTNLLVDRCEAIIQYLKDQGIPVDGYEDKLAIGRAAWEKILREAPQVQSRIAPIMRAHAAKIRADIQSYEAHVRLPGRDGGGGIQTLRYRRGAVDGAIGGLRSVAGQRTR